MIATARSGAERSHSGALPFEPTRAPWKLASQPLLPTSNLRLTLTTRQPPPPSVSTQVAAWPRLLTGARKLECEGYKWHRQVRKAPRMFGAAIGRAIEKEGKGGGKPEQQRPLRQAASAVRISIRGLVVAARSCPASFTTLLYDLARSGLQLLIHGEG